MTNQFNNAYLLIIIQNKCCLPSVEWNLLFFSSKILSLGKLNTCSNLEGFIYVSLRFHNVCVECRGGECEKGDQGQSVSPRHCSRSAGLTSSLQTGRNTPKIIERLSQSQGQVGLEPRSLGQFKTILLCGPSTCQPSYPLLAGFMYSFSNTALALHFLSAASLFSKQDLSNTSFQGPCPCLSLLPLFSFPGFQTVRSSLPSSLHVLSQIFP